MQLKWRRIGLALGAAFGALALASSGATASPPAPPTAEEYSRQPAISTVSISPDGSTLAAISCPEGKATFIALWNLNDPKAKPVSFSAPAGQRFYSVQFVKDDRLLVGAAVTVTREATKQSWEIRRNYLLTTDGKNSMIISGTVLDRMPRDPDHVLTGSSSSVAVLDLKSGKSKGLWGGSERYFDFRADFDGVIRARQRAWFDGGKVYVAQWLLDPQTKQWSEHFRWYAKDREPMELAGFTSDPNIVFIRTTKGRDKAAIYEYDIHARQLKAPAFEHRMFDADGVVQATDAAHFGEILGFTYDGPEEQAIYWTAPDLAAAEAAARTALSQKEQQLDWIDPGTGERYRLAAAEGASVRIVDWSDDRKRLVLIRSGPRTPPEYYLMAEGKLRLLARSRPWIKAESLGDMRLVEYAARDGLQIPAYLTTPPASVYGPGPYPTIVLPHGGPWARDDLDWDGSGWVQYFAARGYAVFQPQFRGSKGWGQKLWRAGDNEWGQKMQDDLDDGARWLIAKGVAAPDRIAMHGFSYGGYAALVAAIRPNGLYQCAIDGAGPANLEVVRHEVVDDRFTREFQAPTVNGLDPMEHVSDASIPLLIYHGEEDGRVSIKHAENLDKAMTTANRPHRFVRFAGMGHTAGDTPELQAKLLTTLEGYLKTECGPGGL